MGDFSSYLSTLALMAAVVLVFRLFVRRPRGVSQEDSPGVRTIAVFSGSEPEFFAEDRVDGPLVGIRLFTMLLDDLTTRGIAVSNRAPVQCAQGAECEVDGEKFALVLEWIDPRWVLGIDWVPTSAAERRHIALTHQVYAPRDSQALRRLLETLDGWLKQHPGLSHVRWYRKEKWIMEDTTDPAESPIGRGATG